LFLLDPRACEISTLSLHDALPIFGARETDAEFVDHDDGVHVDGVSHRCSFFLLIAVRPSPMKFADTTTSTMAIAGARSSQGAARSEEHTSELQSRENLVCRLLLEK